MSCFYRHLSFLSHRCLLQALSVCLISFLLCSLIVYASPFMCIFLFFGIFSALFIVLISPFCLTCSYSTISFFLFYSLSFNVFKLFLSPCLLLSFLFPFILPFSFISPYVPPLTFSLPPFIPPLSFPLPHILLSYSLP